MIVVRAWPDRPPAGRARVEDGWPRVPVDDYDYRRLAETGDDVISMDWDIAASREDVTGFAARAAQEPARVLVAPCRMYATPEGRWNLARFDAGMRDREVAEGTPLVHVFGFGLVYLPRALILAYLKDCPGQRLMDIPFSVWHYETHGEARADWTVRPVHLHYSEAETGRL